MWWWGSGTVYLAMARPEKIDRALETLARVKVAFVCKSDSAQKQVRSCVGCDAHCCKVGFNSMRVHRIEAEALRRRLLEDDLRPLIPGILEKAKSEIREQGLSEDENASYNCPLLSDEGRCLVHGPAQPAGCLTFSPVDDGGCDHDFAFFAKHVKKIRAAERKAYGRESEPLPIPVALLRMFRTERPDPERPAGPAGDRRGARSPRTRG